MKEERKMAEKKPNVLMILIDDMGWKDLSGCGSSFYESPNIDALMQRGMMFDNAYAACPVCSPSRASILTGKYPATVGVTDWIDNSGECHPVKGFLIDAPYIKHLPLDEYNLARCMKDSGYRTYHVGKWHLGTSSYYPEHQGFDVNIAGCHLGHPHHGYFSPYHIENLPDGPDGEYLTDRLTDEAVRLIRDNGDQPFFMNLWHYTVHTPTMAKEEDIEYFRKKAAKMGIDKVNPFVEGEHFPTQHKRDQRVTRRIIQSDVVYAAMIRNLDKNVGRVLDVLEETGKLDDTVIILTSDNGGLSTAESSPTCNYPAREGKGWMYEGGTRVPLSITLPGAVRAGMHSQVPTSSPDLYPTILELCGLPLQKQQHVDGISLLPALQGREMADRPLFWHYPHYGNQGGTPGSSVRYGKWKLIEFFEDMHTELYDLEADPSEITDLSGSCPDECRRLKDLLHGWRASIEAKIPQRNPDWNPAV